MKSPEAGTFEFYSPMCGKHNAWNVVGVAALLMVGGDWKGVEAFQEALRTFEGIKRRQDEVFTSSSLIVIDDFAHHPTAIDETIAAIRGRYPDRLIAAFFEPRSATSARNLLAKDFESCFDKADSVFLVPPSKTNIPAAEKLDVPVMLEHMSTRAAHKGHALLCKNSVDELAEAFGEWKKSTTKPVVALVMSNGPFGGIHQKLTKFA